MQSHCITQNNSSLNNAVYQSINQSIDKSNQIKSNKKLLGTKMVVRHRREAKKATEVSKIFEGFFSRTYHLMTRYLTKYQFTNLPISRVPLLWRLLERALKLARHNNNGICRDRNWALERDLQSSRVCNIICSSLWMGLLVGAIPGNLRQAFTSSRATLYVNNPFS